MHIYNNFLSSLFVTKKSNLYCQNDKLEKVKKNNH